MNDVAATCRALRVWRHGKPTAVRWIAENTIHNLIHLARGRATPKLYAVIDDEMEQMTAFRIATP